MADSKTVLAGVEFGDFSGVGKVETKTEMIFITCVKLVGVSHP